MNLPNLLSLLRLFMVPVFAAVFFSPRPDAHTLAAVIYLLAFLTDVADGYIARHFHMVTALGRVLDPLADKLMAFTVLLCITVAGILPVWALAVLAAKEAAMGIGGLLLYRRMGDVISANWLGKVSTFVFFAVCMALLLFPGLPGPWATGLVSLALLLAAAAFVSYLLQFLSAWQHFLPRRGK